MVAALAAAGALLGPAVADAKRVRVFAVGPKFELSWAESREQYRAKLLALFDERLRGAGAPAIQRGAPDVAGHLLGPADGSRPVETARDLVALPEDVGLMASFVGARGMAARSAPSLEAAIASLLVSYAPGLAHYEARHPGLAARGIPTRLLALALTDTFARVAVETFAELADRYDVYLEAGVNMARDWRVVCTSRATFRAPPGAEGCDEENAPKVASLRDPEEPDRDYAYEAATADAVNMGLIFDPDGRLISKQVKAYLTPVELPGQLDLKPGPVSGLGPVRTPVGTLGVVTSKDAWMPDVTAKLDQAHVDVLIQPEFFVNDTVRTTGMWAPDTLKSSGYADILRHPSMEVLVLPEMTGNVIDFSADAQQHIAVKPRAGAPRGALVGQPTVPGFAQVAPWLVKDPLEEQEPFAQRRRRLGLAGEAALPRQGNPPCPDATQPGPCRGGQVESVLFQDVTVAATRPYRPRARRKRGRTPFGVSRPIAPSVRSQRNVSLAAAGRRAYAVFEERRGGRDQIALARSSDGGATWTRPLRPTGRPPRSADEGWPSVSLGPDGTLWVAWQDDHTGVPRAYAARSRNHGRTFSAPIALDPSPPPDVHQWRPSIAALPGGTAVAAWIDERRRSADDDLPQAALHVARISGGATEAAVRLDAGTPVPLAEKLHHTWAPSIAARGRTVLVTWLDFRGYDWDVWARESADGGESWSEERAVNDTPPADEALNDTPRAALAAEGPLIAWTDWRKRAESATAPHRLHDIMVARPGRANRRADHNGPAQVASFAPALLALPRRGALVAWQDHVKGPGDIVLARIREGAGGSRAVRVDDSGRAGWNQWRPALALARGRILAAWEDERDGPPQIFVARARPSAIP